MAANALENKTPSIIAKTNNLHWNEYYPSEYLSHHYFIYLSDSYSKNELNSLFFFSSSYINLSINKLYVILCISSVTNCK